jgi:hypothetical protein
MTMCIAWRRHHRFNGFLCCYCERLSCEGLYVDVPHVQYLQHIGDMNCPDTNKTTCFWT